MLQEVHGYLTAAWPYLYQQALQTINGLAEGSLSEADMEEEIDDFLADPDNKSILDLPNNREVAADRLKENAQ